jgi:uncharacterized protein (DUF1015 family)
MLGRSSKRVSLLENARGLSPKLTSVIRQKEANGPGWIGTAFLIALLSRHDLSSSDKSWIQNQIYASKGEEGEDGEQLIQPIKSRYAIVYEGLQNTYKIGQPVLVTVSAKDENGKVLYPECTLPAAEIKRERNVAHIQWQSTARAVQVLTCRANGRQYRKLVKVL